MKLKIATLLLIGSFAMFSMNAATAAAPKWKVVTFTVYGNCGMCKTTIEKSLKKVEGVKFAVWDKDTKKITVKYNPEVINLDDIHKKIAAVGYDTEKATADDAVYSNLHGCCQYERPKK